MSHVTAVALIVLAALVLIAAGVLVGGLLVVWCVESALRGANL